MAIKNFLDGQSPDNFTVSAYLCILRDDINGIFGTLARKRLHQVAPGKFHKNVIIKWLLKNL